MLEVSQKKGVRKITISLPASILELVDQLAQEQASNRSAVIAGMVEKLAQERFETEMREGYIANHDLAQQMAEDNLAAGNEA